MGGRSGQVCSLKVSRTSASMHTRHFQALVSLFIYLWPQRPAGLVETASDELAKRWTPILNLPMSRASMFATKFIQQEDLHDGVTFENVPGACGRTTAAPTCSTIPHYVPQCLDYLDNIDIYKDRIKMFHVICRVQSRRDARAFMAAIRAVNRAGRFRLAWRRQVDFGAVFQDGGQ